MAGPIVSIIKKFHDNCFTYTLATSKKRRPLYKGQNGCIVLYSEVSLFHF